MSSRSKFSGQMKPHLLAALRDLSESEGRHLHALLEEAVEDLLKKRGRGEARAHVIEAYRESVKKYGALYQRLAAERE